MKKIHLLTDNNSLFREHFSKLKYETVPHDNPWKNSGGVTRFSHGDLAVYQSSDSVLPFIGRHVSGNPGCTHICFTGEITAKQRDFFLANGIADVPQNTAPKELAEYIDILLHPHGENRGPILVYDDRENHIKILNSIISRFGYRPVPVKSTTDFFQAMGKEGFHFFLVNLGSGSMELGDFVRHCHGCAEIKRSPLISYKDMGEGLFVNEVISGLNRYSTYILSPEELYSFLVDILFRKELIPLIKTLNTESRFNQFSNYCGDSLGQIYHSAKSDILSLPNILDGKSQLSLHKALSMIEKSLLRVSGLRWLRKEQDDNRVNTCGVCG